ncbi:GABBR2 [Branchiostoma lanceolatum]|uniref:GABBR2 protein n=1 Tax=Branchiostoma lanceolatum TaxID=7740 RepID=A0A8J9Z6N7_BRALA|nr:GABBR2 [Branchiostoma lanceolatum]
MEQEQMKNGSEVQYMDVRTITPALFGVVCSFAMMGMILAATILVFNIKLRQQRLIKMSSPNLNNLIVGGSLLLYGAAILFGLDRSVVGGSDKALLHLCQVRTCCVVIGFTLVYGSLFSKTWRVYRIFRSSTVKRMVIRDDKLFATVGVILIVDVLILGIWLGLDPLKWKTVGVPVSRTLDSMPDGIATTGVVWVQRCYSDNTEVWISVFFILKGLLLLYGTYLSWATRGVNFPAMNDAKPIILSIYCCVVLVGIATPLTFHLDQWPDAVYACVAGVLIVCTTVTLCLLFMPKVKLWKEWANNKNLKSLGSPQFLNKSSHPCNSPPNTAPEAPGGQANHCNQTKDGADGNQATGGKEDAVSSKGASRTSLILDTEMAKLLEENRTLRSLLKEKETNIKALQERVSSAKDKLLNLVAQVNPDSGFESASTVQREDSVDTNKETTNKMAAMFPGGQRSAHAHAPSRDVLTQRHDGKGSVKLSSTSSDTSSLSCTRETAVNSPANGTPSRTLRYIQEQGNAIAEDLKYADGLFTMSLDTDGYPPRNGDRDLYDLYRSEGAWDDYYYDLSDSDLSVYDMMSEDCDRAMTYGGRTQSTILTGSQLSPVCTGMGNPNFRSRDSLSSLSSDDDDDDDLLKFFPPPQSILKNNPIGARTQPACTKLQTVASINSEKPFSNSYNINLWNNMKKGRASHSVECNVKHTGKSTELVLSPVAFSSSYQDTLV